jgi:NADPH-dependent 2,4-dienoyl-CoA reductase/sulfur reductase-like enzyme/CxxC motif-containing protein
MKNIAAELVVIGGGAAGLAAAIEAKRSGIKQVIILERAEELGGLLYQCIHNGFGLQYFNEDLTGPEYAWYFLQEFKKYNIDVYLETMVLEITPDKEIIAVNSRDGMLNIKTKAVVLAMGCRERPREALRIPGDRPAGIFTAGTAQRLINVEGYIPGKKIVILGSGDIGMIMARRLTLEAARVETIVEILPYIGGLIRNEAQCVRDFNIPVYLEHTVTNIYGNRRIEGVDIAQVDNQLNPIAGTEKRIDCDTLILSVGLIPENELSRKCGIKIDSCTGGPIVDEDMQTNIPGIFAAGNVVHVHDLVDYVSLSGEKAGASAARYIQGRLKRMKCNICITRGQNIRYVIPHYITSEKDVSLYLRVGQPAEEGILKVGNLLEKKIHKAKPSEMIKIDLSKNKLSDLNVEELIVNFLIQEKNSKSEVTEQKGEEIICLVCPLACRGWVINKNGVIEKMVGFRCKKGKDYAEKEIKAPERVLTTVVKTTNPAQPLLPVRTDRPVPKELLMNCMTITSEVEIKEPLEIGEVILHNLLNTRVDLIATLKFPFKQGL